MIKRIPQEKREEIQRLYNSGLKASEIARQTGIHYASVYGMTKALERVNPETNKPFESLSELQEHQARKRVNPETGKPFESRTEYQEHLAQKRVNPKTGKPFESLNELYEYYVKPKFNPKTGKPFESLTEYQTHFARQRAENVQNKELSDLIRSRLEKIGQNQIWLANQIGVSKSAINTYVKGYSIPRVENLMKIFEALGIKKDKLPKSLDGLLEGEGA